MNKLSRPIVSIWLGSIGLMVIVACCYLCFRSYNGFNHSRVVDTEEILASLKSEDRRNRIVAITFLLETDAQINKNIVEKIDEICFESEKGEYNEDEIICKCISELRAKWKYSPPALSP